MHHIHFLNQVPLIFKSSGLGRVIEARYSSVSQPLAFNKLVAQEYPSNLVNKILHKANDNLKIKGDRVIKINITNFT
ncbi:unnamed protein product [Rhizophagus irregularis]|uniref:Uncharacterized protein n=1 Tax=Rhizophagus irregularis TaxID=588596 RepID=A0A915Z6U0_9GLOM|nr:unnamed protein product [Rhizophagus irregularis]CAB5364088.1 unnamed protein product [Rhizophagus irregularis]